MYTLKELVRNHLLAATMRGAWKTLKEIKVAIYDDVGTRYERKEIWKNLLELSRDGVHTLDYRHRGGKWQSGKEYRLHVKPEAIMSTPKFEREPTSWKTRRA